MYNDGNHYCVIYMSGSGYEIHKVTKTLNTYEDKVLIKKTIELPNQHKTGGQSSVRFSRLRDEAFHAYVIRVAEMCVSHLLIDNNTDTWVSGIIICGPSNLKRQLIETDLFKKYFRSKLLNVIDTREIEYLNIIEESKQAIELAENGKMREVLDTVKNLLVTGDLLVFGMKEIREQLEEKMLKSIYISDEMYNKNELEKLIDYSCDVNVIPGSLIKEIGIECIGVKWY